ncbi:MAG: arginine--tRNA ligase, partial [Rhodoluna sp.]
MTPEALSDAIVRTLQALVASGALAAADLPDSVVIERPKNREHGDWATNVAMQLAGKFCVKPRELADALAAELVNTEGIVKVDVAGP